MRLGIMGGTFDPIHFGHLFVAEEARVRFRLAHVLFVPNGHPPHKREGDLSPAAHRFAMTCLAVGDNPAFHCSSMEMKPQPAPSYTVETLTELRLEHPEADLFYITGVDAIADILTWRRHEEVIRLATFIAATRPGFDPQALKDRLPQAYLERIQLLCSTTLNISSTEIRTRMRQNLPVRYMLPDSVLDYIREHGLYRDMDAPLTPAEEHRS